jgi:mono/diheme cytochrome c family protein
MIRTILRLALIVGMALLAVLAAGAGYLLTAYPRTAPPRAVQVPRTIERIARGRYLANHVAGCVGCHGQRDWSKASAPLVPAVVGRGGMKFDLGDAGTIHAPNITPAGIGEWTDGELIRAFTEGISRDGRALFPLMPYDNYGKMSTFDIESIVAYLRTLPPIQQPPTPPRVLHFPLNVIVRTIPAPATPPVAAPDPADRIAYGKYMTTMASCVHCHSPREKGQIIEGMEFAGGGELRLPDGTLQLSANITPDPDTGIGHMSETEFVERFKMWDQMDEAQLAMKPGQRNTDMPWRDFAGMTREDLGAIYNYLRTLKPVRHQVPKP